MKEAQILQFQDTSNVIGSSPRTLWKINILERNRKDKCIYVMQAVWERTLLHNCAFQMVHRHAIYQQKLEAVS